MMSVQQFFQWISLSWKILKEAPQTSLKQRLLKGSFWSLLGAVTGKGFVLLAFIGVARIIGQHAYGELGIIRSTINMFIAVSGMGVGYTASKYIAQYRISDSRRAGEIYALSNIMSVSVGFIGAVVLIFCAQYIADNSLQAPHLSTDIKIGAVVLFFTTINGIQSGALSGFEAFRSLAINTFISGLVQSFFLVLLSEFYGVSGCIGALGIGCMSLGLLNACSIRKEFDKYGITYDIREIRRNTLGVLWKFSFPALLSSLVVIPILWWAKTHLVSHSGYGDMAVFDVADQWSLMVLFVPGTLAQIILPLLSNTLAEGTKRQYIKLVKVNLFLNFVISVTVAFFVILLGRFIMSLYGKDFVELRPLYLMMIASVFMSVCNVVGQVIASRDKMWIGFAFNLVWVVWIAVFTILFEEYGATGLALSITCSYALHFIGQLVYLIIYLRK